MNNAPVNRNARDSSWALFLAHSWKLAAGSFLSNVLIERLCDYVFGLIANQLLNYLAAFEDQ
jgi:hypothetical protein